MNFCKFRSLRTFATLATGFVLPMAIAPALHAQVNIGIQIGTPPPPLRYEVHPVYPGPGYAWRDGYWAPFRGRYRWHRGLWVPQPFADAYYVRPYYDHENEGYRFRPGHWEHRGEGRPDDHFNGDHYNRDFHDNGKHGDKEHHDNGKHGDHGHD